MAVGQAGRGKLEGEGLPGRRNVGRSEKEPREARAQPLSQPLWLARFKSSRLESFIHSQRSTTTRRIHEGIRQREKEKMATTGVQLVDRLPLRLRNFFARYPPQIYSAQATPRESPSEALAQAQAQAQTQGQGQGQTAVASTPTELENNPEKSPYTPNRDAKGHRRPDPATYFSPSRALLHNDPKHPNPFLPQKLQNGKWAGPRYGLRRQAELVKLAIKYDVEALLPAGRKSTEFKETKRAERGGLAVKGTGVGQKVKGHKWERTMEARLEDRRKAMAEMPEMIRLWKQVSFSRLYVQCKHWNGSNMIAERSWSWLEAVAQEVDFYYLPWFVSITR